MTGRGTHMAGDDCRFNGTSGCEWGQGTQVASLLYIYTSHLYVYLDHAGKAPRPLEVQKYIFHALVEICSMVNPLAETIPT